jgi:hypothetical protein
VMIKQQIIGLITLVSTALTPASQAMGELLSPLPAIKEEVLAEHFLDLKVRSESDAVNEVFKDNILLALEYYGYSFILKPEEVFAFHANIASEFADLPVKTGGTNYTAKEGYKTILGLPGNGVCHLASLMNWTAADAGLEVTARVNHDFAPIPEVPREYGTSIRYMPAGGNSQNQNLYIKNTFDFPVKFVFTTDSESVSLKIAKMAL